MHLKKNLFYLVTSNIISRTFTFIVSVINRRILGPESIGVFNLIQVFIQNLGPISLNMGASAERLMPYYRSREEYLQDQQIRSAAFSTSIAESLIVGIIFLISLLFFDYGNKDIKAWLIFVPFFLVLMKILASYQLTLKNLKYFKEYSVSNIVLAAAGVVTVILVYMFRLPGLVFGSLFAISSSIIYMWWTAKKRKLFTWHLSFPIRIIRSELAFTIPYSLWSFVFVIGQRIDSLYVSLFLGTTALGFYYLGPQLSNMLSEIPISILIIAYPDMMGHLGKTGSLSSYKNEINRYTNILIYFLLPLTVAFGFFGIDFLVKDLIPKFIPGLEAMKIVLFSVLFMSVSGLYSQVFIAIKNIKLLILFSAVSLASFFIALTFFNYLTGISLVTIAWSILISQFTYLLLILGKVYSFIDGVKNKSCCKDKFILLLTLFFWMILLLAINYFAPPLTGASLAFDFLASVSRFVTFLLFASPFIFYGLKNFNVPLEKDGKCVL